MRNFANALCVGRPRDALGDALSAPLCGPFGIEPCFTVSTKGRCRYRKKGKRMTAHPGKTAAQRRVLDEIGCGNHSPIMAKSTRDKLLRDGLIVELAPDISKSFGPFRIEIRRFEMPIPVHAQWCGAMAAEADAQEKAR